MARNVETYGYIQGYPTVFPTNVINKSSITTIHTSTLHWSLKAFLYIVFEHYSHIIGLIKLKLYYNVVWASIAQQLGNTVCES